MKERFKLGIIILAAGFSFRFKQAGGQGNKLLARQANGHPLLALTLQQAHASGLPLLLVTRAEYHDILNLAEQYDVPVITTASNGSSESIAAGVQKTKGWSCWLIQPGDMAWVTAQDHLCVMQALVGGAQQVRLSWQNTPGHPVGFAAQYGEALSLLKGDNGARTLLDPVLLKTFVAHPGVIRDADLPVFTNRS